MEKLGDGAVGGELNGGVRDVEKLGGDVALPEPRETFGAQDVSDCREGALVDGPAADDFGAALVDERVREGVVLQLEADLDDVEGGDDETVGRQYGGMLVTEVRWAKDFLRQLSRERGLVTDVPRDQAGRCAGGCHLKAGTLILEAFGLARHSSSTRYSGETGEVGAPGKRGLSDA